MIALIVATDFSPLAENAVDYAAAIAKHYHARLVLFNAFIVPVPVANGMLTVTDFDNLLLDNRSLLKERAEQLIQSHGIRVDYETSYSIIPEELEKLLAKYQAELIVLGMEPESLKQNIFGNTTTSVIRNLNCPVLAVPQGAHFEGFRKILFACDLAHSVAADVLAKVKGWGQAFTAEMEVLFVQEKNAQPTASNMEYNNMAIIADKLEGISYSYKKVTGDAVINAIREEIMAADIDLLIMAPKVYSFWLSVLHRSKTRIMASGLTIPMLAIPE